MTTTMTTITAVFLKSLFQAVAPVPLKLAASQLNWKYQTPCPFSSGSLGQYHRLLLARLLCPVFHRMLRRSQLRHLHLVNPCQDSRPYQTRHSLAYSPAQRPPQILWDWHEHSFRPDGKPQHSSCSSSSALLGWGALIHRPHRRQEWQ